MKWKLVPDEPTPEMLRIFHDKIRISVNPAERTASVLNDTEIIQKIMDAAPNPLKDEGLARTIASVLDHPSVFMGGPSHQNMRKARAAIAAMMGGE